MFNLNESLNKIQAARTAHEIAVKEAKADTSKKMPREVNFDLMEKMTRNVFGDFSKGKANLRETLTSADTIKLVPKVIEGKLRESVQPTLLGTNFFSKVRVEGGNSAVYIIPVVGELVAFEVTEAGRYRENYVEMNTLENSQIEIRVKKIGTKVSITEEAISDSSWDILGLNIRKMGQAMGRYKEEWIFNEFSGGGNPIFDNSLAEQNPQAMTTGLGKDGNYNGTLSVEDFLDMALTIIGNGFQPSDMIMHPLVWVVFARNGMIGNGLSYGALGANSVHYQGAIQGNPDSFGIQNSGDGQKMIMSPDQVQGRLPMPMTLNFSPYVRFDRENRLFDAYVVDRSEVGVIVEKEGLSTDQWLDSERDIKNLKVKERYGIGLLNEGQAISVCKNIAVAPSYPMPPQVTVNTNSLV